MKLKFPKIVLDNQDFYIAKAEDGLRSIVAQTYSGKENRIIFGKTAEAGPDDLAVATLEDITANDAVPLKTIDAGVVIWFNDDYDIVRLDNTDAKAPVKARGKSPSMADRDAMAAERLL